MSQRDYFALATSRQVVSTALKVAVLVGTILALINHGEKIFSFSLTNKDMFKIMLSYFVPYGVSTWSAVSALRISKHSSA